MGVLDKFLDIMKLSDDEDYDDDFYDDEYDDDFEEKPKKSFFKKNNKGKDFDDEEEYQEQMDKYKDTINAWLKGDRDDQYILDSYMSYLENSLGIMNMVLIIDYLKKLSVI